VNSLFVQSMNNTFECDEHVKSFQIFECDQAPKHREGNLIKALRRRGISRFLSRQVDIRLRAEDQSIRTAALQTLDV
jgi:hypothetical protein